MQTTLSRTINTRCDLITFNQSKYDSNQKSLSDNYASFRPEKRKQQTTILSKILITVEMIDDCNNITSKKPAYLLHVNPKICLIDAKQFQYKLVFSYGKHVTTYRLYFCECWE